MGSSESEISTLLLRAVQSLAVLNDLDDVVDHTATLFLEMTGHTRATVLLWSAERDDFTVAASRGTDPFEAGVGFQLSEVAPSVRNLLTSRHSAVVDFDLPPTSDGAPQGVEASARDALAIPLVYRETLLGIVAMDDPGAHASYSKRDIELAEGIAAAAGIAIEHARLRESEVAAQRDAAERLRTSDLLLEAADLLGEWTDLSSGLDRLGGIMLQAIPHNRTVVYRFEEATNELVVLSSCGRPVPPPGAAFRLDDMMPVARDILQDKRSRVIDVSSLSEQDRGITSEYGVRLLLAVPLLRGDRALGIIVVDDSEVPDRKFEEREVEIVEAFAAQIAGAVENARLFEGEVEAQRLALRQLTHTTLLNAVALAATTSVSVNEVAERVLDATVEGLDLKAGTIHSFDRSSGRLLLLASYGIENPYLEQVREILADADNPMLISKAVIERRVFSGDDVPMSEARREMLAELGGSQEDRNVAIPIEAGGEIAGVLGFVFDRESALSPDEIAVYRSLAGIVGQAIENARLFDDEQAALARAELLREIAAIGASTLDLKELAERALATVHRMLGVTTGNVFVLDEGTRVLRSLANYGIPDEALKLYQKVSLDSDTASARVALTGRIATHDSPDVPGATHHVERVTGAAESGWIILPVNVRGKTLGTLGLSFERRRRFEEAELSLFQSLADQIGIAMEKAQLFEAEQAARAAEAVRAERLSVLTAIAESAASALDPHTVASRILTSVLTLFAARQVQIRLLSDDGSVLESAGSAGLPEGFLERLGPIPVDSDAETAVCFRSNELRIGEDVLASQPSATSRRNAQDAGVRSYVLLPLVARGEAIGTFYVAWAEPRHFGPEEISFLEAVASASVTGLQNSRLFEAEHEAARLSAALAEVDALIHSSLDFEEVTARALAAGAKAIGAETGAIIGVEGDGWLTWASYNFEPSVVGVRLTNEENPHGVVAVTTLKPVAVDDAYTDPRVDNEFMKGYGLRSVVVAPLVIRAKAVAALYYNYNAATHRFTSAEVDFVAQVASSLSLALENARLFDSEKARRERLQALQEVTELAASSLDSHEVAERTQRYLVDHLGIAVVTVWLMDDDSQRLHPLSVVGFPPEFIEEFADGVALDSPFEIATAFRTRGPVVRDAGHIHEVPEPVRSAYEKYGAPLESLLVLPLKGKRTDVGAITLAWKEPRSFAEEDVAFFVSIVNALAVAMENARLFEAVRESEARFRVLFETMTEGFALNEIIVDDQGKPCDFRYLELNPAFEHQTGLRAVDVRGKTLLELFPDSEPVWVERYGKVALGGEPDRFQDQFGPLDRWFDVSVYQTVPGRFAVVFFDVTERKAAEEAARESHERLTDILNSMTDGFVSVDSEWRYILVNPRAEEMLNLPAAEVLGKSMEHLYPNMFGWPQYRKVMDERTPETFEVWSKPLETWLEVHAYPTAAGISILFADITERKHTQDLIEAERRRLREVIDDVPLGITLFDPHGVVVEINEANRRIWRGDLAQPLSAIDYGVGRVFRLDGTEPLPPEEFPAVRVLSTGLTAVDIAEIERFDGTRAKVRFSATPITDANAELSRVVLITEDVTQVLEAQRLDEALSAIGTAVTTTLDAEEILSRLVKLSAEAVGAETAGLALTESHAWVMKETFGMSASARSALTDPKLEAAILEATTHSPIVVNDTAEDPRVTSTLMRRLGVKSLMVVPILTQQAVVGALVFHHRAEKIAFTAEEIDFAGRLMDIATLALENARLYEREHKIADTLQAAVLTPPEQVPRVESAFVYRPASNTANIGGDFYDVFAIDDDHLAIVVGDVSGKGLDAARFTSLMHDGVRAYAYEDWHPSQVLNRMNRLVHRMSPVDTFATMFFGVLEPSTGQLYHCTAGHPHPALVGSDSSRFLEGGRAPLLGAFVESRYCEAKDVLGTGEMLVLYTDGITEARSDEGMFGEARLLTTLAKLRHAATRKMPQRLLAAVLKFAGGRLSDDIVILCVKRTSSPADKPASE